MARVLHLIDSLALGGAERVAVNLVNVLHQKEHTAWLCATRAEGALQSQIEDQERYFFLKKGSLGDIKAFRRLCDVLRREKIEIIHAHSSSIYWAVAAKWCTGCRLVWHDHLGAREQTRFWSRIVLKCCSIWMDGVCCAGKELAAWATKNLWVSPHKILTVNHFATLQKSDHKRENAPVNILCTANLRPEKDHITLLEAMDKVAQTPSLPDWRLYLVGNSGNQDYLDQLVKRVEFLGLGARVVFAGPQTEMGPWLNNAHIGVLSSRTEALPVALLEYGLAGLAVVCTDAGACKEVLSECGIVVPSADPEALANGLISLLRSEELRQQLGKSFEMRVRQRYSPEAAVTQLEKIYQEVLQ